MKAVRHLGILIVLSVIRVAFSFVPAHKGQWAESTHCHTHTASEVLALRSDELGHMMKVAVRASKAAGDLIVQHSKRGIAKTKKSNSRDLVTAIDVLCEKVRFILCTHLTRLNLAPSLNTSCCDTSDHSEDNSTRVSRA